MINQVEDEKTEDELECTCPIGQENPECPEHRRLKEMHESDSSNQTTG